MLQIRQSRIHFLNQKCLMNRYPRCSFVKNILIFKSYSVSEVKLHPSDQTGVNRLSRTSHPQPHGSIDKSSGLRQFFQLYDTKLALLLFINSDLRAGGKVLVDRNFRHLPFPLNNIASPWAFFIYGPIIHCAKDEIDYFIVI